MYSSILLIDDDNIAYYVITIGENLTSPLSHFPLSTPPPLPYLYPTPLPLGPSMHPPPLPLSQSALLQGKAVRFPAVSEAARWLVCDARWRGGGCQVRAVDLFTFSLQAVFA